MRPKPFDPEIQDNPSYVRDRKTGICWHRCEMRTLYVDTDRSQVVYHANYLRYFEFGRAELMRDADYPYKQIEASGYIYPIIKTELNYFSPLFYDDLMYIHTRPTTLELVKVQFDYLIVRAETGEIACTGFTRHCAVNSNHIPVEIDDRTIALWKQFPQGPPPPPCACRSPTGIGTTASTAGSSCRRWRQWACLQKGHRSYIRP